MVLTPWDRTLCWPAEAPARHQTRGPLAVMGSPRAEVLIRPWDRSLWWARRELGVVISPQHRSDHLLV